MDGADLLCGHDQLRTSFSSRAARANDQLYWGTLGAFGVSGLLIGLLLAAFALGRHHVAVVERRALERSRRRFRALVHKASEAVFVIDTDRRISDATDAVRALLGHEPEALLGRRLDELVPPTEHLRAASTARPRDPVRAGSVAVAVDHPEA